MMYLLEDINNVILEAVNNNVDSVSINMDEYSNSISNVCIKIPQSIKSITFIQGETNNTNYNMGIDIALRNSSILVNILNLKLNTDEFISLDFRASAVNINESYLIFSGNNIITSISNIAICVSNNQKVIIQGTDARAVLIANGGPQCATIGNSAEIPIGGSITFSGFGTVYANGGDSVSTSESAYNSIGKDGGIGIGFVKETIGTSIISFFNMINIFAVGGNGENMYYSENVFLKNAGNGGDAVCAGADCSIEKYSSGFLCAYGGKGGSLEEGIGEYAGDGGNGISVGCGKIQINNNCDLRGGDGGNYGNGGNGGSAVYIRSQCSQSSYVFIDGSSRAYGGNGGNGEPYLYNTDLDLTGGDGGNGGNIITAERSEVFVNIDTMTAYLGNGGNGGSPYDVYGNDGYGIPGNGGDTGSLIYGISVNYNEDLQGIAINTGSAGVSGRAISEESGEIKNGINGIVNPVLNYENNKRAVLNFGKINISPEIVYFNKDLEVFINEKINCYISAEFLKCQRVYDKKHPIILCDILFYLNMEAFFKEYKKMIINVLSKNILMPDDSK